MPELIIDETRCTRCGLCTTACPQNLIRSNDGLFPRYGTACASRCITCGLTICAMMLGYPRLRYLRPPRRNPGSLTWR